MSYVSHQFRDGPGAPVGGRLGSSSSLSPSSSSSRGGPSTRDTLVSYIERACDPTLHEPNLSLDLEIADFINQKKANTPRDAAVHVVRLVNHRNTHVAMLALHLLDLLVKNCGYPFHLQISTKDFLNELVRRFPERPPVFPPPPMAKILELVHEWKNTICVHSKHKEDLTHIRDMHRLLSYKGYRFPEFDKRAASVLNPSNSLQTPEELEEEDRAAQAAKLQELIRRGTPKDLAAAQELMKIMSGAEPDKKPNYEEQVERELERVRQRALLLNEMLDNAKPKERFADGDAFYQIATKCRQVQPKIKKWIEESSAEGEPGQIERLLEMNDLLNAVLNRYEAFKSGDRSARADIASAAAGTKRPPQQDSLIDFDDSEDASAVNGDSNNPIDDLTALSSLNLGTSNNTAPTSSIPASAGSLFDLSFPTNTNSTPASGSYFSNPSLFSTTTSTSNGQPSQSQSSASAPWGSPSMSGSPLAARSTTPTAGAIQLGGGGGAGSASGSRTNSGTTGYGQGQAQAQGQTQSANKKKDPFEDLLA